jgi:hypothetical protein
MTSGGDRNPANADRSPTGTAVRRLRICPACSRPAAGGSLPPSGRNRARWDICDAERRVVVGDVHTHPGRSVHQSGIDAENPMVAQDGHVAVILPDYATRPIEPHEAGIHRYEGGQWTTWTGRAAANHLFVRRLA